MLGWRPLRAALAEDSACTILGGIAQEKNVGLFVILPESFVETRSDVLGKTRKSDASEERPNEIPAMGSRLCAAVR